MERVDVILGHNVQYIGSVSRLPILVLECSEGGQLEGGPCQTGLKFGFFFSLTPASPASSATASMTLKNHMKNKINGANNVIFRRMLLPILG